jgi:hypothetical protein
VCLGKSARNLFAYIVVFLWLLLILHWRFT